MKKKYLPKTQQKQGITMHCNKTIQNFAAELFKKFTGFSVIISFTFAQILIPYQASAENITDVSYLVPDGSTNTTTDRALNNTPIVNIAAPSAAGVSLNNFSDYNVTNENQILNNYKGISTNTNLAGQIYGNPNFNPSAVNEARVIVNQVTSTNRTNINGYIEIAGGRAELVVANPNGISLSGAGFINTSRLGLVSGLVNMSGGAISGFNLGNNANSNVIITGVNTPAYINLGLDASTVDYVDIITRSAQVLGDIHAKSELNFSLGNGTYDYATKTLNSNTGVDFAPTFALDSNYLGGMYAGKISLIASEVGIGVRTRGDLVSKASDINFNVIGDIDYERMESQTNINLTSNNGKITQGKYLTIERPALTLAKNNITLTGASGIELNDSSAANNFYAASEIFLNSAAGLVKNNSTIKAETAITIDSESFENTSLIFSTNSLSITTSGLAKNTSGSIEALKNVTITAGSFNNAAIIKAGIDANFTSSTNFIDTNQIKASRDLTITANSGIAYNNFYSGRNLSLTNKASGNITSSYKSYSVGTTDITNLAGAIILGSVGNPTSGSLFSGENLEISASSIFASNLDIFSNKDINLTASAITTNQKLTAADAKLTASSSGSFINNGALLVKDFELTASTLFKNTANFQSSEKIIANNSTSFENSSLMQAGENISLTLSSTFLDTNQIKATGNLTISAHGGISYNDLYSGANLSLTNSASGNITHNYKSYSAGKTDIINNAGNITFGLVDNSNDGSLFSVANLAINASGSITNHSNIFSNAKIDITASGLANNMRIMAVGTSESDLTINLDLNLLNRGLLFANNDINLNVDGTITNDGTYNAEIFALNGNVNINGKLYSTSFGNVSKYDFFYLSFDKSAEIWADLLAKGYIDSDGEVTNLFKNLASASEMSVASTLSTYKDAIFDTLNNLSAKIIESGVGANSLDRIEKDFDSKASDIYAALYSNGYIDSAGKVLQKFYDDTKTSGASGLSLGSDADISYLKQDIYQLLEDARNGKVIENTFLGISGIVTAGLSSTLIDELKAKNYIDSDGNVTSLFTALSDADSLDLSADFDSYKSDIFNQINATKSVNKTAISNFNSISYQPVNSINNFSLLYSQMLADGYIDSSGNIQNKFYTDSKTITSSAFLDSYKTAIANTFNTKLDKGQAVVGDFSAISYVTVDAVNPDITDFASLYAELQTQGYIDASGNIQDKYYTDSKSVTAANLADYKTTLESIFNSKGSNGQIAAADFSSVSYSAINDIADSSALYSQLKTEGFIDSLGNITEKFYTDGIASSTSSLTNYQSSVNTILSGITQTSLASKDFRKITKSLDNSAERLVSELITKGYLDENGQKTTAFPTDEASFALESTATGGEFATAKTAIFNALNAKDSSYAFSGQDFLGDGFDSAVFFNENEILMSNLISSGYLSSKGDIKKSFYNLSGSYSDLVLDSRFLGLKNQIGTLIADASPAPTAITSTDLIPVAQGNTRDKAEQIFNKLVAKGYVNAKGDLTAKVMDEVINFAGTDEQKAAQLSLDDLSAYSSGIFQQLKANYDTTTIKSFATKLENLNGGKISSSLGDIKIKALTFNNLAKDNKDVISNPENGVARTAYRGIGWAWKNTVLWGYDAVSSTLTSQQSFLKAGQNIDIEANNIWNNSSVITAGNNIDLRTANLKNSRTQFIVSVPYIYETHWKRCKKWGSCNSGRYKNWHYNNATLSSNTAAIISSGNNLYIAALADVRLDAATKDASLAAVNPTQSESNPTKPSASKTSLTGASTAPSSAATSLTAASAAPSSDTWTITIPTNNNGLFKKASPTSDYLIETAYNAGDPNYLTGSAYYKSRFGFDPNQNNIKWLGDPFYQWNAINEQIVKITKKQEDWNIWAKNNAMTSGNNWQANLNQLIDNAYNQKAALNLVPGVKLTTTQIAALTSDIVWYETETVNGQQVSVPRVYLSKKSFNRIELKSVGESAILAAKVNISGNNVSNNGTIFASKNINIFATSNIENGGTINAVGNLALTTEIGSITSASVVNKPQVIANESLPLLVRMASLSGNNITLNSGKNITLSNTLLNSNNATLLNAKGDVTIANDNSFRDAVDKLAAASSSSTSLSSSTSTSSSSPFTTSSIKDEAASARAAATFNSGTDIEINSSGSINVANNYFNTGGSIFMTAANDITNSNYRIKAAENVIMSATNINNISTAKTAAEAELNPTKIEAGSIVSLDATNNINNIGATIKAQDLVYLTAGNNVNNLALVSYAINGQTTNKDRTITTGSAKRGTLTTTISGYSTDLETGLTSNAITEAQALASNANNIKSTLISQSSIESSGNVVVIAGRNLNNKGSNITAAGAAYLEATAGDINVSTALLRDRTVTSWGNKKKSGTNTSDTTTNIESNITSNGNLDLASLAGDINITGSKLNSNGNLTLSAADDVNISAAQNTSFKESTYQKKGMTVSKSSMSVKQTLTNVKSELEAGGDISITSGDNTNLIGVKLTAENAAINAGKEINVFSVADKSYSHSSSSKSRNLSGITNVGAIRIILSAAPAYGMGAIGISSIAGVGALGLALNTSSSVKSNSTTHDKTSNVASIVEATGNLTLASNQNLTISGSNLSGATGSLTSNAGSISILSAAEIDRTTTTSSQISGRTKIPGFKGSKKTSESEDETITNIVSNLNFTDSLEVKTLSGEASDINITGSNLGVSDGDLTLSSTGNINIVNAIDSTLSTSSTNKKGNTRKSKSVSGDYVETAAESSLSANNINISSLGDTTIQGSTIDTSNNLIIGSFTIDTNSDGSYKKDEFGNYVTTSGSTVDNLVIKNAELKEYHYAQTSRGYAGIAAVGMRMMPYVLAPVMIVSDLARKELAMILPDSLEAVYMKYHPLGLAMTQVDNLSDKVSQMKISESTKSRIDSTTAHASTINVGGSMMTNSVGDTTIQGSDLNIAGNLLSNSLGDFTISAATNKTSSSSSTDYETAGKFHSDLNVSHVNYKAGTTKEFVEEGETQNSTTLSSSNVNVGGSTLINSSDEFALLASNLITTGSTEINAKNTLNILDGKETQSTSSYLDKLTLDVGVQVGNAYADAAYAVVDAVKAQKAVKDAYDKLEKIENLQDQGLASSKSVERAKYQVVLALMNAGLSALAAMQAVGNAGQAAATSAGTGFYGSVYADITKLKSTTTSEYAQSIASNLTSGDAIYLNSGTSDINITGSNITSTNGNLNLTAMLGAINIKAGESTYSQSSKSRSQNLGGSVGNNGFSANLGFTESESSLDQTTFSNSQLLAENGSLNLNSKTDTNIIGANLLANDINLTVGGNLLVKSKQNLLESDFYSVGASLGASGDSSGVGGVNTGFNMADGFQSKAWVEELTSVIGTNSVTINAANDTKIVGAEIANVRGGIDYGNLTLNTKSLTFENLQNHNNSESNSFGINLSLGIKPTDPTAPQNSQAAKKKEGVLPGSLGLNLSMQGSESSSTTNATIGKGTININGSAATTEQTANLNRDINNIETNKKTVITSDFESTLNIDTRYLAAAYYAATGDSTKAGNNLGSVWGDVTKGLDESVKDLRAVGAGLKYVRTTAEDNLGTTGKVLSAPTQVIEGAIFTFFEQKNNAEGSHLYLKDKNGKIITTNNAADAKNYGLNGVNTTLEAAQEKYLTNNSDVIFRYNPTHGVVGDLIESGFGKIFNVIGTPELVAMNRFAAEDIYQRSSLENATNTYHSQGTIIGVGAMQIYADTYQLGFDQSGNKLPRWEGVQVNPSQVFFAAGPAVLDKDWRDSVALNLNLKSRKNADWSQNPQDPVRYLAAPSNIFGNSKIYVPNLLNLPLGVWDAIMHMDQHDVTNPSYSQFLKNGSQNSQNLSTAPPK